MEISAVPDLYEENGIKSLSFYDETKQSGFALSRSSEADYVEVMYSDQNCFPLEEASIMVSTRGLEATFDNEACRHVKVHFIQSALDASQIFTVLEGILLSCPNVELRYGG